MTTAQLEELQKNNIGKRISNWQGWAYNVSLSNGNYLVQIAMAAPSNAWARDIEVAGVAKEIAMRLNVRQPVTFSGTIKRIDNYGSNCNPIYLDSAAIQ
jgi:hypothetical protein